MNTTINLTKLEQKRKEILDSYRKKQSFKVSTGQKYLINGEEKMAKWFDYEFFQKKWKLREVLKDEIVIEFDNNDKYLTLKGINFTALNLYNAGYSFEIWDHGGKSPHLHLHNLPIAHLEKDKLRLFKKLFIRKYVPKEFLNWVDISLTGIHLLAIEESPHWKGCYGTKELIFKFNPEKDLDIIKGAEEK